MEQETLADLMEGVTSRLERIRAEYDRCQGILDDPESDFPSKFAAQWVQKEIRLGLEDSAVTVRRLAGSPTEA